MLRVARKVAPDRVISTADPQARHGHKTNHRGFDGYKGHIAIDPDAEIITATAVTPGLLRSRVVADQGMDQVVGSAVSASGGAGDVGFAVGAVVSDGGVA